MSIYPVWHHQHGLETGLSVRHGLETGLSVGPHVLMLLLVALALRLVSITWGLPLDEYTTYYHPDEKKIVSGAMDFPTDILERQDLRYPTFYHYAIGTLTLPLRWAMALMPGVAAGVDLYLVHHLIARLCSVVLGTLTVPVVYWLAKRLYDARVALLSAALVAVAGYHVTHSSLTTIDVASSFLVVIALDRCYSLIVDNRRRDYVYLAIASGFLIGTKYTGAVILVPGLLAHLFGVWRSWQPSAGTARTRQLVGFAQRVILSPDLALYLAGTLLVFLFTTPTILLSPQNLVQSMNQEFRSQGAHWASRLDLDMWLRTMKKLGEVTGLPLALVSFLGALRGLVRPRAREILLLSFIVPYYLVLSNKTTGRYTIILLPVFCILAARLLVELESGGWRLEVGSWRLEVGGWRLVGGFFILLVWGWTLGYTLMAIYTRLVSDTRTQAARFITQKIPAGRSICLGDVGNYEDRQWELPPVSAERYVLADCLAEPDYVVLNSRSYRKMAQAMTSKRLQVGYIWDATDADYWLPDPIPQPEVFQFYDDLLNHKGIHYAYDLIAEFDSPEYAPIEYEAPTIRIYRMARLVALPQKVQHPMQVDLDGQVRFLGYDLERTTVKPGDLLRVTFYWQAQRRMETSYTVFTHLLDAQNRIRGQKDSLPMAGAHPTTRWLEGEVITDTYAIPVAPDAPSGPYTLKIGMYELATMQRLPAFDEASNRLTDDCIPLGQIEVTR
jgi:hypothetical protein